MEEMDQEAQAFDSQIAERIIQGHIPDIRLTQPCEYFYNNSWRRPEYVKIDMGEKVDLIDSVLRHRQSLQAEPLRVLEVGCGPGWLSLELARLGYRVTGLDLSSNCINVAMKQARSDPWLASRGALEYFTGDFFQSGFADGSFDAVVFLGSLHHFADQRKVMVEVERVLGPEGIVVAHEPTRDRMTEGNAAFIHLLPVILSAGKGYYQETPIPADITVHEKEISQIYREMKYEDERGENVQSAHDNDAGHKEMYAALLESFSELEYRERYSFFHEMIGGLRFDQATNNLLARYLRDADGKLCKLGVLQPTEFLFVGRKKAL